MRSEAWFNSWGRLVEIAVSAVVVYAAVVVLLRVFGKRTTSKMNNFDWIVTVAVGTLASSGLLLKGVAVTDALVGIVALITLQWLLHHGVIRNEWICRLVKATPTLLVDAGELREEAMRSTRVSEPEILAAVREAGYGRLEDTQWVVLEADATLSVIGRSDDLDLATASAMSNVE